MSFEEESGAEVAQLKLKSAHDLLKTDPKLSQSVKKDDDKGAKDVQVHGLQKELTETSEMLKQKKAETEILSKSNIVERFVYLIRPHIIFATSIRNNEQQQSEIARLEQEIREMKRKPRDVTDKKSIKRQKESLLEQETSRFLKKASVASRAMSEDETLARLQSFQQRIRGSTGDNRDKSQAAHVCSVHNIPNCGSCAVDNTLPTSKATERGNWTDNWLQFPKDLTGKDLLDPNSRRVDNADDLVVVDPRKRRQ